MSEQNVEIVRQTLNAFIEVDEGLADLDRMEEFFTPDAVLDMGNILEVAGPEKASFTLMSSSNGEPPGSMHLTISATGPRISLTRGLTRLR